MSFLTKPFQSRARPPVTAPVMPPGLEHSMSGLPTSNYLGGVSDLVNLLSTNTSYTVATETGLIGLPAAWRCLNLISNAVALMMQSAHVYNGEDEEQAKPSIIKRPNNLYTPYEFYAEMTATLLMHGNWIAIKTAYDESGQPTQLIPVHPDNVEHVVTDSGYPWYKIGDQYYAYDQLIHIRGFTVPGNWWGLGVIEAQRQAVVGSIDMQSYGANTFRTGSVPSVLIILKDAKGAVSQETLDGIATNWMTAHGSGQRKPAVVPNNIEVQPLSFSPQDAQYIGAMQNDVAKITFMFGLDPTDLGAALVGHSMTYSNIEQRAIARITDSYAPWFNRIEQSLSDLLPDDDYVRANPESLLRTDAKTRLEVLKLGLEIGAWDADYVKEKAS